MGVVKSKGVGIGRPTLFLDSCVPLVSFMSICVW